MGLATTALRVITGSLMAGHGLQKLTTSFGGHGVEGTAAGFEKMGFTPGRPFALAAGVTETAGGVLLAAGLEVPLAAAMVTGVMTTAIAKVHLKNGVWVSKGGFEYNLVLIGSAFAVAADGGGALALDSLRGKRRRGFGWAVGELALGVGAAVATMKFAERQAGLPDGSASSVADDPEATPATPSTSPSAGAGVTSPLSSVTQKESAGSDATGTLDLSGSTASTSSGSTSS
jgi:putative oxidoreductase